MKKIIKNVQPNKKKGTIVGEMANSNKSKKAQMSNTVKLIIIVLFIVFALVVIANVMRKILGSGQ